MIGAALCVVVGAATFSLPVDRFTLRWQHTVEKVLWEEDYLLAGGWLYLTGARVRGSGAGMEPPPDAVRLDGAWHYRPRERWHRALQLARSAFGRDYELCAGSACRPLADWAPAPLAATTLEPCPASNGRR